MLTGRASSRGRRNHSKVDIRPLHKDSRLLLCGYRPRCTKGDNCTHAHSEEELESWRSQLLETVRPYKQDCHRLGLCRTINESASNKYCRKILDCEYAHSQHELDRWIEEQEIIKAELCGRIRDFRCDHHQLKLCASLRENHQCCKKGLECMFAHSDKELDSWKEHLECRNSEKKLLEMCRNATRTCKYGEECRYAHNDRELQTWKEEHHQNYLQSVASIPERCSYTMPTPTCQLGTLCPYAHIEEEREKLILQLIDYDKTEPRPIPRRDKLLPYTLCDNHVNERRSFKGECIYGRHCNQAHNKYELASWEAERKAEELRIPAVRLYIASECSLSLCKDAARGVGRGVARGVAVVGHSCSGERCPYAHSEDELHEWIRKSHSAMLGPPALPDNPDPFLIGLVDYQRRFSDELASVLNAVVIMAVHDKTLRGKLGSFIDHNRQKIDPTSEEGQDSASLRDIQYLLGYIQRNSSEFASYLGMKKDYLTGVVSDLLEIRNILAHGLYRKDRDVSEKTEKFIRKGIDFIQRIVARQQAASNGYEDSTDDDNDDDKDDDDSSSNAIHSGYATLVNLQDTFREFLSYQRENEKRVKAYSSMKPVDKKAAAFETLKAIQKLLEEETEPGPVTSFLATSLSARFKNKM